jgi:hypothetical protein
VLVDINQPDAAATMLSLLRGDALRIVKLEARRPELAAARARAIATRPRCCGRMRRPG